MAIAHIAVNGLEAVEVVRQALAENDPYQLICLDVMMPGLDGHETLRQIRAAEEAKGITSTYGAKIIMATANESIKSVSTAYYGLCDAYLVKPIDRSELLQTLRNLGLIQA